jgi:Mg-chelatase subunit ChlD
MRSLICGGLRFFPILMACLILGLARNASAQDSAVKPAAADDFESLGMKVSVTIIFDTSGSMDDNNKLVMAKRAFNWWLDSAPLSSITQWSLYVFDPQTHKGKALINRKTAAVAELKLAIQNLRADGGTPLAKTIDSITKVIDAENKKAEEGKADILRQVVLIFTDGKDSYVKPREVQKRVKKLRDAGSEVFSIGYQGEGDYLAKTSDKFIMVGDEKQLKAGLSSFNYFIEKSSGSPK